MLPMFERHDLVFFNRSSIDTVIKNAHCVLPHAPPEYGDELFEAVGTRIPGIVRRQENTQPGFVDVGFSSPRRVNGVHYRAGASVPVTDIVSVVTPFRVMQMARKNENVSNGHVLAKLHSIASNYGITLGLLGSYALQLVTGLPYVSTSSDIDLIAKGPLELLGDFSSDIDDCKKAHQILIDIEVRVPVQSGVCDVKLKELTARQASVVGKSISDVKLLRWRYDAIQSLILCEY